MQMNVDERRRNRMGRRSPQMNADKERHHREDREERRADADELGYRARTTDMDEIRPEVKQSVVEGGAALCCREWAPKDPKGTVVCVHGIRSHSAWYLDSCAHLARKGYRVLFPDRRGSGLNREGGSGGEARVGGWVADVEHFIARAARELPEKPVHLIGISWGGRLAAVVAAAGRVPVRSVVLSTPGIVSLRDCGLLTKIGVAAALLTRADREFAIPLDDPALFTDDPDERNYIDGDKFGVRRVSARFLLESRKLERLAKRSFRALSVPVLLMLAGRDEIVDNAGVKKLFEKCPSADRVLKVYPEARHTLEFDACREEYFDDLAAWFDAHGEKSSAAD